MKKAKLDASGLKKATPYTVFDPNTIDRQVPDVYDEELQEFEDAIDPLFLADQSESVAYEAQKKRKRNVERLSTLEDLEDFYGEDGAVDLGATEDNGDAEAMDTFDPSWDYLDDAFVVGKRPEGGISHERIPVNQDIGTGKDAFMYQQTETTYGLNPMTHKPEIRLFGTTQDGHSVLTRVQNVYPYFYVGVPSQDEMDYIKPRLEVFLERSVPRRRNEQRPTHFILNVEPVRGRSLCGYHKNEPLGLMFKITLARPSYIPLARKCFDFGNRAVVNKSYPTFEANVPFELRYMIDTQLYGCQWFSLKENLYRRVHEDECISTCQYEFEVDHEKTPIIPINVEEKGDLAPLRILSYDIEVLSKEARFPTPDRNAVITICCALHVTGKGIVDRAVFVLRSTKGRFKPIDGATVYEFTDERHLLMAFTQYVQDCDPDGLTGWNTSNFDMPFLAGRAKQLNMLEAFMSFSRMRDKPAWLRERVFQSKAYGAKKNTELVCEGRFDFDALIFMLRGQMRKFRMYTLDHIASQIVGETKLDVNYSQIPLLYESDEDDDRTRLAHYCLQDAILPLRILDKMDAVVNGVEQARVTGVPFKWLLAKGQGVKTQSNLLRCKESVEFVPTMSQRSSTGETGGGHVEEPRRGWYDKPVITLDFSSLYPSIMIAHNICYTTKVDRAWAEKNLKKEDYWDPWPAIDGGDPTAFVFVKKHIREGVLPKMLAGLLKARSDVKAMMKTVNPSDFFYGVLNGRQLALKVVCNSVYGFLKAFILRDKDLMSAVTSYGRNMIYKVKEVVEREFREREVVNVEACLKRGLDPEDASIHDQLPKRLVSAFIVYGDTDSVMVCFGDLQGKQKKRRLGAQQTLSSLWGRQEKEDFVQVRSAAADTIQPVHVILAEVIRMGKEMAQRCTDEFEAPNSLTFETIKLRGCWLNKKRYFALEIEKFIEGERFEDAVKRASISIKGLEGKRRDNAFINSSTQKHIINILLYENDIAKMERFIESRMRDLLLGRVDIHELVITKGLAKTEEQYAKGGTKQQHVELRKRMAKRAKFTGEVVPETGDRVPYIVRASTNEAKSSKSAEKASELSEHPLYAQQHAVPINTQYYIDKQIWPAVARIMTAIYEPERCPEIQSAMPQKTKESLRVYKRFFAPSCEHLRVRNVKMAGSYGIGGMTIVLPRCLGCGARIAKGASCNQCSHADIVKGLLEKKSLQEKRVQEAWDTCRKCQGGSFEKVTCSNLTCKNFFHREQVKMDLEQIEDRLKRLEF